METADDIFDSAPFFNVDNLSYTTPPNEIPLKHNNSHDTPNTEIPGITLQWGNICVTAPAQISPFLFGIHTSKKTVVGPTVKILNNVSGLANPGSLVAIVGPSAVINSTLLKALALSISYPLSVTGRVAVNGQMLQRHHMQQMTGFVDANNPFYSTITVTEHLSFTAKLKLDSRFTNEQIQQRIKGIVNQTGLRPRDKELTGNLSTSDLKRLAIATEIIGDPPLLYCDEPTKGLKDQQEAHNIVGLLETMAAKGKTIVCAIQQPTSNVLTMFTDLCLLGDNGKVAFMGPIREAAHFFESLGYVSPPFINQANLYSQKVTLNSAGHLKFICRKFSSSRYSLRLTNTIVSSIGRPDELSLDCYVKYNAARYKTTWLTQFILLLRRTMTNTSRRRSLALNRITQKLLMGIMIAVLYFNADPKTPWNCMGIALILLMANTHPTLYTTIQCLSNEIPCLLREYHDNFYRIETFYLARVLVTIPECVIESFLSVSVVYWIIGLNNDVTSFLLTALLIIVMTSLATAIGSLFSSIFEDISASAFILIPLDCFMLVLGGLFNSVRSIHPALRWLQYVSWFRYANEALHIIQWNEKLLQNSNSTISQDFNSTLSIEQMHFEIQGFKEEHLGFCFIALSLLYIGFHVISCFILYLKIKYKYCRHGERHKII